MVKRGPWLSVTPEPERELPAAVATLLACGRPRPEEVRFHERRIERLILFGGRRRWLSYLHEVVGLIEATPPGGPELERARRVAAEVIGNHHNLVLAHPGSAARLTAPDRARLQRFGAGATPEPRRG